MESISLLSQGFSDALTWSNLFSVIVGSLVGTIVGILPGLGSSATVAILIPVAYTMPADSGMIMMIAVYFGAMYGASTTAILLNIPGAPSVVIATADGYPLAQQGRAGPAISITAIGSFLGSMIAILGLMFLITPLSQFALKFGSIEYTAVMVFALVMSATLMGGSLLKGFLSIGLGLAIAIVGVDLQSGITRFTFDISHLMSGIDMIVVIIGVFGVGEVLYFLVEQKKEVNPGKRIAIQGSLVPTKKDLKESAMPYIRGGIIGFISGLLPGSGSTIGSYISYSFEKRISKHPERFGKGEMKGLAAVDTANNASVGGALVPMFSLGVPGSGTTAVLLGALMMYGVAPGPQFISSQPDLFWTIVASLFISNLVLIILNLPLIPLFVKILDIPSRILMPLVLAIAMMGTYTINGSFNDLWLLLIFGILGFFMKVTGLSPALLVLAIVLGVKLEQYFRRAVILSKGDIMTFFTSGISMTLLSVALGFILYDIFKTLKTKKEEN